MATEDGVDALGAVDLAVGDFFAIGSGTILEDGVENIDILRAGLKEKCGEGDLDVADFAEKPAELVLEGEAGGGKADRGIMGAGEELGDAAREPAE